MPTNFMRHYYDIHQLLAQPKVLAFVGAEQSTIRLEMVGLQLPPADRANVTSMLLIGPAQA